MVKVGINGFGRIGRIVFRTCIQNSEIQLSAINDPAIDIEYICYLIKFDSTHGKFTGTIAYTNDVIMIDDHPIKVFREKLPSLIPWHTADVEYVVEASGMFTCFEKASGHLQSPGVKRVIVTAPSVDVPMVVLGVNDCKVDIDQKILSSASSTLYCLAPIIKILSDNFGVVDGFITSIHAMTPSLKPLDGLCLKGKHWRDHRSIHQNIIPASTGACKALGKIIPQVKDKMTGLAFRVPIVNVSLLDLTIRLEMNTSLQGIFKQVEEASKTSFRNIIRLSNENAVSSDFMGDHHSCIVDVNSTMQLKPNFFKIICWYENEFSYACRVLDTIFLSEKQFSTLNMMSPKTTSVQSAQAESKEHRQKTELSNTSVTTRSSNIEDRNMSCNTGGITSKLNFQPAGLKALLHRSSAKRHISPDKLKTEKIQNDVSDPPKTTLRQNIGSFFHSCTTFALKVSKKSEYPLDRLENLLNKSCNTPQDTSRLDKQDIAHGCIEERESHKDTKPTHKRVNNRVPVDVSGSTISDKFKSYWDICEKLSSYNKLEIKKSSSDYNIKVDVKKIEKLESNTVELKSSKKSTCLSDNGFNTKEKILEENVVADNSKEISSRKALFRELHSKYREQLNKKSKTRSITITNNKIPLPKEKTHFDHVKTGELKITRKDGNVEAGQSNGTKNGQQNDAANMDQPTYGVKDLTQYLSTKNHNMQIMDKELKKRNIVLVNKQNYGFAKKIANDHSKLSIVNEQRNSNKVLGSKKWTTDLNKFPVMSFESPSNTVTTISNGDAKRTESDLYDKLDSTSATNSDQSFDVNEKKSQIINISDLSNSLEDLARLDKICRIIEISDELSDKLFSCLDNTDMKGLEKKQWSFKDLCKRIELDKFCNQVFGKTGV